MLIIFFVIYSVIYHGTLKKYTFDSTTRELINNLDKNPQHHVQVIDQFLTLHPDYEYGDDEKEWININDSETLKKFQQRCRTNKFHYEQSAK